MNHREALLKMFDGKIVTDSSPIYLRHQVDGTGLVSPIFRWSETEQEIQWDQYRSFNWKRCDRAFWVLSKNFQIAEG